MATPRDPRTRPFRVAVYVIFITFNLAWIALVARSVAKDLWGTEPVTGLRAQTPGVGNCAAELDALSRRIDARSSLAMPRTRAAERDWDIFTREFEDRLGVVKSRCLGTGDEATREAMTRLVDKLETLRLHLSRCGEEGEAERRSVYDGLSDLQRIMKQPAQ